MLVSAGHWHLRMSNEMQGPSARARCRTHRTPCLRLRALPRGHQATRRGGICASPRRGHRNFKRHRPGRTQAPGGVCRRLNHAKATRSRASRCPWPRVGELASWRVGELASWRVGELASWRVGELASWRVGELASWRVGELASWRVGELASWRVGGVGELASLGPITGRGLGSELRVEPAASGVAVEHGAQRHPGCRVALLHVAICLWRPARLRRRSAAPAAGSRVPAPGGGGCGSSPSEQGSSR